MGTMLSSQKPLPRRTAMSPAQLESWRRPQDGSCNMRSRLASNARSQCWRRPARVPDHKDLLPPQLCYMRLYFPPKLLQGSLFLLETRGGALCLRRGTNLKICASSSLCTCCCSMFTRFTDRSTASCRLHAPASLHVAARRRRLRDFHIPDRGP